MNPYFAFAFQAVLAIFSAFCVALLGFAAFKRTYALDNSLIKLNSLTTDFNQLKADYEALKTENENTKKEISNLRSEASEFRREAVLCKAARRSLVEASLILSAQIRELHQVPKIDMEALMSGMNEGAL